MKRLIASTVVVSLIALFRRPASASHFLNISTRADVETGASAMIGGFIITGTDPKPIIVRALVRAADFGIVSGLASVQVYRLDQGVRHSAAR